MLPNNQWKTKTSPSHGFDDHPRRPNAEADYSSTPLHTALRSPHPFPSHLADDDPTAYQSHAKKSDYFFFFTVAAVEDELGKLYKKNLISNYFSSLKEMEIFPEF
jgi:hypothetical protein